LFKPSKDQKLLVYETLQKQKPTELEMNHMGEMISKFDEFFLATLLKQILKFQVVLINFKFTCKYEEDKE
jgi:hypothetical protein